MTTTSRPELPATASVSSSRLVVATDWTNPVHVIAAIRAFSQLWHPRSTAELVVAVPASPSQDDVARVTKIIEANRIPVAGPVTLESFTEAKSKPYDAALIPDGSRTALLVNTADFVARLGQLTTALDRVSNEGEPSLLREDLTRFTEADNDQVQQPGSCDGPHWHGTYVGEGRVLVALATGGRVYLPSDNRATTPNVMQTGDFEPELHAYIRSVVPEGGFAVDVGANLGILTVALARAVGESGRVIAIEPVPSNLEFLRWNIETNWIMDRVQVVEAAASDRPGETAMQISDDWNSLGSIVQESIEYAPGHPAGKQRSLLVKTVRLDDLLAHEAPIDLVKIDVEGAEPLVFEGMRRLLTQGAIDRVAFECMSEHIGKAWPGFMTLLAGYESAGWSFGIPDTLGSVLPVPVAALGASKNFRCVIMEKPGLRPPVRARRL